MVHDCSIASLVGIKTYCRLWYSFPHLYEKLEECDVLSIEKEREKGVNPEITDFNTFFVDSDYTPLDLKKDLCLMAKGQNPSNCIARSLLNTSLIKTSYSCSLEVKLLMLAGIVLFWVVVISSVGLMINYYFRREFPPSDLFRMFPTK